MFSHKRKCVQEDTSYFLVLFSLVFVWFCLSPSLFVSLRLSCAFSPLLGVKWRNLRHSGETRLRKLILTEEKRNGFLCFLLLYFLYGKCDFTVRQLRLRFDIRYYIQILVSVSTMSYGTGRVVFGLLAVYHHCTSKSPKMLFVSLLVITKRQIRQHVSTRLYSMNIFAESCLIAPFFSVAHHDRHFLAFLPQKIFLERLSLSHLCL